MEELQENEFTGKTVEEAVAEGLKTLGITQEEAEITVVEEGKKKLFGSVKAKVKVVKKATDSERASAFIDGLLKILKIPAFNEIVSDGEKIEIEIKTTNTSAVIGRRGEVLDAIQCIAGAVANIGRDEYRRVVVDCENYRAAREEKLTAIAVAKAQKAVEKAHRVALDPMSPYERRVVHSALAENAEVKTVSEGKEPLRRVVIIPNNEKPYERKPYKGRPYDNTRRPAQGGRQFNRDKRYGERREGGYKREDGENREGREYNGNRGYRKDGGYNRDKRYGDRNNDRSRQSRPARGKKEIYLGTYLGNSGAGKETPAPENTEKPENKEE
ncbi:MAG: Jag N-terminal domain-containing protein [Clostridia bacterium]|nr:Jag N-terminal domain-containing protein [Clostridia bacterium]